MFAVAKHLLPYFKEVKNGHILAISSIYGTVSRKGRSAYAMSKHALNGLVKTMALEFAQYGVKTNALAPGFVGTVMTYKNNSQDTIDSFTEKIPLGRLAEPKDIANAAYFLCSEDNTYKLFHLQHSPAHHLIISLNLHEFLLLDYTHSHLSLYPGTYSSSFHMLS